MPIEFLDLILLIVMLISGLLAMIRGFIREILSIAAWALAAVAGVYGYAKLLPSVKDSFGSDIVAAVVVVGGAFLLTLLVVSVITVRISDMILDSRVGALDRTLGFLFGLGRGLIIVVVAYLFFDWLVQPADKQPDWVRNAKSKVVLQATGEWLKSLLPDDPEGLYQRLRRRPKGDEAEPQEQRSDDRRAEPEGYGRSDRASMQQLIQGATKPR
jgi:membrane protein required for colicin V production